MNEHRAVLIALYFGIALIVASFIKGGLTGDAHSLSNEKAKEIQEARRELHSLSHKYAHQAAGDAPSLNAEGELELIDKATIEEAEARFNRLHAEVEAIRKSRPWLTSLLRYSGVALCLLAGMMQFANRPQPEPELDQASASSISTYETAVRRRS